MDCLVRCPGRFDRDRTATGHRRNNVNNNADCKCCATASLPHTKQNGMQEVPMFAALLAVCLLNGKQGGIIRQLQHRFGAQGSEQLL